MNVPEEKSKIDALKKSLYSRMAPDIRLKRRLRFTKKDYDVKTDWEKPPEEPLEEVHLNEQYESHSMSFFTKFLIASVIFFVIAMGIGAYLVFNGSNIVSANNVDILITGPISVAGGEVLPLDIQVFNKNNIKLEVVDLSLEFPEGTANPENTAQELKTFREGIPDIEPGGVDQKTVNAVLFGEENSKKIIKVKVEYRVSGSNALFYKEKDYEVLVTSSPITLTVSSFKEVNSGQEFDLTVTMTSNSSEVLKSILLKGAYPFGFTYLSSSVKPVGDNSTWRIGDIPPKGKKSIVIRGKLEGQDDESRVFRFVAGAQSAKNDKTIGTRYIAAAQELTIKKPFISVNVSLDNDALNQEYIGQFNSTIRAEVTWFNNLPTAVNDAEIHVKLSGTAFDKASVSPDQGFYNSSDNEIVWTRVTTKELASIGAGESGRVTFSFVPRDLSTNVRPVQNPDVSVDVSVKGKRTSETNVPESIASSASRHIRVSSNVALSGQVVRSVGPFVNSGPIPPVAEKQTTYTVIWTVYNTSSNVANAQVRATLPPYVKWAGKVSPENESVTYSSTDGQILWNIGNVGAYTGAGIRKKEVAFQVVLEPAVTQVGQFPTLINDAVLTAMDSFTGLQLKSTQEALGTRFSADPAFKNGDEAVQR